MTEHDKTINLTNAQVNEIVGDLQIGLRVFYNLKTQEIISLVDLDSYGDVTDEMVDEWNELEANRSNYIEIENMDSTKAFDLMKNFIGEVDKIHTRNRLTEALASRKPFANFKKEIEYNEDYREKWFEYRDRKMIEFILNQLSKKQSI